MTNEQELQIADIQPRIRKLEMFSELNDEELDMLLKHSKLEFVEENDFLFQEGDDGNFFAIILDGCLEVEKHSDTGIPVGIAQLTTNDTIGEMSIIDNQTRSASAVALQPTNVFILSKESFDKLVEEHPRCGVKLIRKIAGLICTNVRNTSKIVTGTMLALE